LLQHTAIHCIEMENNYEAHKTYAKQDRK